jgi:hypothetical protein
MDVITSVSRRSGASTRRIRTRFIVTSATKPKNRRRNCPNLIG